MNNQQILYKFRSGDYLFDELRNHEIYFSPLDTLNDPIEGYKEVVWQADEIAWKNLFKHYVLCLLNSLTLLSIAGDKFLEQEAKISVFSSPRTFPSDVYRNIYNKTWEKFSASCNIDRLTSSIVKRDKPIGKQELVFYLDKLHLHVIDAIVNQGSELPLLHKKNWDKFFESSHDPDDLLSPEFFESLNKLESEELVHKLFFTRSKIVQESNLLNLELNSYIMSQKFIFVDYPEKYLEELSKLMHWNSHVACFSGNCTKASMWSYYANNHKGICLKFKIEEKSSDEYILPLYNASKKYKDPDSIKNLLEHKLRKVDYSSQLPELNFFHSIGLTTVADLQEFWFKEGVNKSTCFDYVFSSEENWRQNYLEKYYTTVSTKLKDWEHEEEYRLILTDTLHQYKKDEGRKLRYKPSSLDGIIFGLRTPLEDKRKIIKILIEEFDEESLKHIKIYQADYENQNGKIQHYELASALY